MRDLKGAEISVGHRVMVIYCNDKHDLEWLQRAAHFYRNYKNAVDSVEYVLDLLKKIEKPENP